MSKPRIEIESPQYFNSKGIGRSLREVSVDTIPTENDDVVSRWYQGNSSTHLFTWADARNIIIKQQINFNGHVVEWNCIEGVKTGLIVEVDVGIPDQGGERIHVSESIRFDKNAQNYSVCLALEILQHTALEPKVRDQLISNFRNPQSADTLKPEEFAERFGTRPSFWKRLKTKFTSFLG